MSLTFNSQSPITVTYKKGSGAVQNVSRVTYNGVQVWPMSTFYKYDSSTNTLYLRGSGAAGYTEWTGGTVETLTNWPWQQATSVITETPIKLPEICTSMFYNCTGLTSLDMSDWDASGVAYMDYMFTGCSNLNSIDLTGLDTSNVVNMNFMFHSCTSLMTIDVSSFDTSKVTTMHSMFALDSSLATLDLSNFNPEHLYVIASMFAGATSLFSVDISGLDTSEVYDMSRTFSGCNSLQHIYVGSDWSTTNVSTSNNMFYQCYLLPNWSSGSITADKAYVGEGGYLENPPTP